VRAPAAGGAWGRYRWAVLSRALAAIFGGYALASALAACLAVWLPLSRVDAVLAGQMLGFVAYAGGAIWVFAARSARAAWAGLLLPTSICTVLFLCQRALGQA
jgi:hypothetical protein